MENIYLKAKSSIGISEREIKQNLNMYLDFYSDIKNVLIIPPDISRLNSYAGNITKILYERYKDINIDIMPALGTHTSMTEKEIQNMYEGLPFDKFLVHDWRNDTVKIGEIPSDFVKEISEGYMDNSIDVEVNKRFLDSEYDLIISIGQVVPHEIAGFANYTKNIMVGCGGSTMINQSHYLGALYGMERIMGRADTPVRKLYNYGTNKFLSHVPLMYILTVTTLDRTGLKLEALSIGLGDELFLETAKVSQEKNLNFLEKAIKKAVVYLDPKEFKTTWLGNKAIYRTRMAIADDGELIIIAPALSGCGEDPENDKLIQKYGYIGRDKVLEAVKNNKELRENLSVAAHLIHGSCEDRFKIIYAPGKMTKEQITSLNYEYMPYEDAIKLYDPDILTDGFNTLNGEEIFYVSNPALGLWTTKSRFESE